MAELHTTLGAGQPYYFGMAACRVASFPLCHADGGAGYGLSRAALAQLAAYLPSAYPRFLERVDKFTYGGEDVSVALSSNGSFVTFHHAPDPPPSRNEAYDTAVHRRH